MIFAIQDIISYIENNFTFKKQLLNGVVTSVWNICFMKLNFGENHVNFSWWSSGL